MTRSLSNRTTKRDELLDSELDMVTGGKTPRF
jgi:hypothetical protein